MRRISPDLKFALEAQASGKTLLAESIYQRILSQSPEDFDGLHYYGVFKAQLGSLSEALSLISQSLIVSPNNTEALLNRASVYLATDRVSDAVSDLKKATTLDPNYASAWLHLGNVYLTKRRYEHAERCFDQALRVKNTLTDALEGRAKARLGRKYVEGAKIDFKNAAESSGNDIGSLARNLKSLVELNDIETAHSILSQHSKSNLLDADLMWIGIVITFQRGDHLNVVRQIRELMSLRPADSNTFLTLGISLCRIGRSKEAELAFQRGLALAPNDADLIYNRAFNLAKSGNHQKAVELYQKALEFTPRHAECVMNLGTSLKQSDRKLEALTQYDRAIELRPGFLDALYNRGVLLQELDRLEDAVDDYESLLAVDPNHKAALLNYGTVLQLLNRNDEARVAYTRLHSLDPGDAKTQWNLGLIALASGDFHSGWKLYESRFQNPDFHDIYSTMPNCKQWTGEPLKKGDRFLVLHEQGLGDSIQFCRYIHEIAKQDVEISILAPTPLHRIFKTLPNVASVSTEISLDGSFNYYSHMMSLPLRFKTAINSIPFSKEAYIYATRESKRKWGPLVADSNGREKIGVCWVGGSASKITGRSIPFNSFSRLMSGDYFFVSLQKELPAHEELAVAETQALKHFGALQQDFYDTAGLIAQVDLVVTVDTSIAHLAGALGIETWILLPVSADWRWMSDRFDSPWYPKVKLFRQRRRNDWIEVIGHVREQLDARRNPCDM